ncbi:nucleotidyltransferase [Haliovirga abyssi]|uniref:tRNA(Met) cytidine acetate ligase n=1 Tax=Haliovirga abyssi TaxID=2996794 RepID=A0AAU9DDA1_9FUSO|nr:nucleotidyltransferase [Haliovirga abyssi]BDU50297.1 UPF0348 protein [Haliovirga abyssi]
MKATGIIVEYNPFHNGHKYHIKKAREVGNSDCIIAVMSGDFLQRGEPAILNKWERTKMALLNGVDIVLELPTIYSTQSAEIFAYGAILVLEAMKVKNLVFGSENGNISNFLNYVDFIEEFKDEIDFEIKKLIKTGISYPNAMSNVIGKKIKIDGFLQPNNILGIEYIKAIRKLNLLIEPLTIKREKSNYNDKDIKGNIASATAIRKTIFEGDIEKIKKAIPEETFGILSKNVKMKNLKKIDDFYQILRYKIISDKEKLLDIQDLEIGLENRLYEAALKAKTFYEFYQLVVTKRYTMSRLYRVFTHILLGITKEMTDNAKNIDSMYGRILGISDIGKKYLRDIKQDESLEIITNLKESKKIKGGKRAIFELGLKSSYIYSIDKEYIEPRFPIFLKY